MEYGDMYGVCERCEEEAPLQYSGYVCMDICEFCWEAVAENAMRE